MALNKKYSHKCFVGDFNFNKINWCNWTTPHNGESKGEQFIEAMRDSYLYQHVEETMRCRGTDNPSTIDLIFTNEENHISKLNYGCPLGKSDHNVLSFTFNCYLELKSHAGRYACESANFTEMRKCLQDSKWSTHFTETATDKTVEVLWNEFKCMLRTK